MKVMGNPPTAFSSSAATNPSPSSLTPHRVHGPNGVPLCTCRLVHSHPSQLSSPLSIVPVISLSFISLFLPHSSLSLFARGGVGSESPLHLFTAPRKRQRVRLTTEFKRREWRDPRCFYLIFFEIRKKVFSPIRLPYFAFVVETMILDNDGKSIWRIW